MATKKIKNLTLEEANKICENSERCVNCPLYAKHYCIYNMYSTYSEEELNKEIEVEE